MLLIDGALVLFVGVPARVRIGEVLLPPLSTMRERAAPLGHRFWGASAGWMQSLNKFGR